MVYEKYFFLAPYNFTLFFFFIEILKIVPNISLTNLMGTSLYIGGHGLAYREIGNFPVGPGGFNMNIDNKTLCHRIYLNVMN